ncbi:MAG: hypothetical protein NC432_02185 [Roseburia sp.]|nr:hypothetical protein [Roseburia sp.]MCM1097500.1 hypothetical protein [Ruminococcus flavefaciens]
MREFDFAKEKYGVYCGEGGCGFLAETSSMPVRRLCPEKLAFTKEGVVMPPCPELAYNRNGNDFDFVGLAFRVDVPGPGIYALEVELSPLSGEARIGANGTHPEQIAQEGFWDAACLIPRVHTASWADRIWSFQYVCGGDSLEIEVEPASPELTVILRRVRVTPLAQAAPNPHDAAEPQAAPNPRDAAEPQAAPNPRDAAEPQAAPDWIPTLYTLGDSTVKSYIYEENLMSAWGQIFDDFFDTSQVTVLNYAMGGRSLATLYREGRANDLFLNARPGDYLLLQSGHNDEARGALDGPEARYGRGNTEETFLARLENYFIPAAKALKLNLILVTPMTRIHGDKTDEENGVIFCGFAKSSSIDCPGLLRQAAERHGLPLVDLYADGNEYLESIGGDATKAIFLSVEAGETAGKTNSGSYANGHPDDKCDGTHYKEALSKQFARLVASSLLRQSLIPERFLLPAVREAIRTGNDYLMLPEMCPDVQTGRGAYYRNQIEFLVKHRIMDKRADGCFHPFEEITAAEFTGALCRAMKLEGFPGEDELTEAGRVLSPDADFAAMGMIHENERALSAGGNDGQALNAEYSDSLLTREKMALLVYRVYLFCFPVTALPADPERPAYTKPPYMTDYNGSGVAFDDPNFDPNLTGQSAMYYPLVPWEQITDRERITPPCRRAVRECYRLGLIRSENGIARGRMVNGTSFDPLTVVTREKAAKELYFLQTLIHDIREETDKF